VPAAWETQGFRDYDGFGWYRVKFHVPEDLLNHKLIMMLGKIDDVDEAYVNGERIGRTGPADSSRWPYHGSGGEWMELRSYTVPAGLLLSNQDNVLAVRVYDGLLQGGIYDGPVGIVKREHFLQWKSAQKERDRWLRDIFDLIIR
jgi:sialate O-acetylesterase